MVRPFLRDDDLTPHEQAAVLDLADDYVEIGFGGFVDLVDGLPQPDVPALGVPMTHGSLPRADRRRTVDRSN